MRGGDHRDGEVRIGRPFRRRVDLDHLDAGLLERLDRAALAGAAVLVVEGPIMIAVSPAFSPKRRERLGAERAPLRLLLGADIAAAELRRHLRHGTFWYIILMPALAASSASGMIGASPGWPIMAMPSGA